MGYLQTEEVYYACATEAQKKILRDVYVKDIERSKTSVPVKSIMDAYQFYNIKKKIY